MSDSKKAQVWTMATGLFLLGTVLVLFFLPFALRSTYTDEEDITSATITSESFLGTASSTVQAAHLPPPDSLRAIYMTSCVAATPSLRQNLKRLIESTELNAVVIDIKDSTGVISFKNEELQPSSSISRGCKVGDMREFIEELHASGIYVIGRLSVFQDPHYTSIHPRLAVKKLSDGTVWKDYKGLSFIDVGAEEYWKYIVDIARASYDIGFDEVNFDYVRYPSDGNMKDTYYSWTAAAVQAPQHTSSTTSAQVRAITKPEMLERFFAYLHSELQDSGMKLSVDLFGLTTTLDNDMGIGQVLERALPYFDYIAPMVYPSHYPKGWNGFANPAEQPYEVIKIAMTRAVEREEAWRVTNGLATSTPSKMRPWLQDFDLGAVYDATKVQAQIQATYDSGLTSWMLWSAANTYTTNALMAE